MTEVEPTRDAGATEGWHFRLATAADAAPLTEFARDIFVRTFGPDNEPAHLEHYVASAFTPEIQRAEIEREDTFTVLAVGAKGSILGYAYVVPGAPEAVEVGQSPIEIKRFYVASGQHGRGLAAAMMRDVMDRSRATRARTIWLAVWERNARAIAFYHKQGFEKVGTKRFLLGDDLQTDWVMQNTHALQ